jgi:hypothetical protein
MHSDFDIQRTVDRDIFLLSFILASLTGNITRMTNNYCCEYSVKTPDDGQ